MREWLKWTERLDDAGCDWQAIPSRQQNATNELSALYPFIKPAIQAHIERFPEDGSFGIPTQILVDILTVNPEASFGELFTEFCKQAPIYGFGDLQVKKLLDQLD